MSWCIACGPFWLADAISNVVLFLPLGAALVGSGKRPARAILIGALLSLTIELLQSRGWPGGRDASVADFLMNSAGTTIGAWAVLSRDYWLWTSVRRSRAYVAGWATLCLVAFGASFWLLAPVAPSIGTSAPVVASTLPYTPDFGWYAGLSDSALVNGTRVPHGGSGPVIVNMPRTDSVRIYVDVRGRDTRYTVVPLVYLHEPGSTESYAMLAQRGDDAVIRQSLRATQWGFLALDLALPNVFAPAARADSAPLQLHAVFTDRQLSLSARDHGNDVAPSTLSVSPLMAWALMQSVVRLESPLAPIMTTLWIFFWVGPIAWWSFRSWHRVKPTGSTWE